ncbi:MAG: 2-oxo acid dehydrogenase subunit E2 [Pirellulaceae bacterium]|nr:2-oxo acid dehydrogenase subunit E2 [Pirellulaceae bacterium]
MATEIKLPSLGDGIDSADVLEIFVSEGEVVQKDQGLMELETDKATVTVPSPVAGKIVKFNVAAGQSVAVGAVFATIEAAAESTPAAVPAAKAPPTPEVKAAPAVVPPKSEPTVLAAGSENNSTSTAKPKASVNGSQEKTVPSAQPASPQVNPIAPENPISEDSTSDGVIPAGPAIRRFAREVGVDLISVTGTGEGGRITRDDVLAVVRLGQQAARSASGNSTGLAVSAPSTGATAMSSAKPAAALPGTAASDDYGPVRIEKMSKIRKTIAAQMHRSWTNVPRVTNFDDADVTDLEIFRQSSKDDYAARGIKLTTMPFLIKAVATALRHHPFLNAAIDPENEQIIYKDYVSIGIAVDTERGLVVPTLKNADRMSIPDIAQGLSDLSMRVRNNNFGVNDLRGGTFTISNLGAIGGTYSTPIVNVPEVAILLVGRTRRMPIVMADDSIKPRSMMPLSLAYDHRLVDGGSAARFLNDIIMYLEAPSRLLLAI